MDDDIDPLTGCQKRSRLEFELWHSLGTRDSDKYIENFLCFDIHHLVDHVGQYGHHGGDAAIQEVASRLLKTGKDVYRFGGDEFVVTGVGTPIANVDDGLAVKLRQCVVAVDLPIQFDRSIRATSWIIAHIQMAMVQPARINDTICCTAPKEWMAG